MTLLILLLKEITLWQDTIRKEMNNVRIAFKVLHGEEDIPPTYQEIRCHMIFELNMEDFHRNAWFVAGGHTTNAPHMMTYASVVSRESVRIALTLVALLFLDVMMGDIENAYVTAPNTDKVLTMLGPEFGEDAGKQSLIVRELYGLKSAKVPSGITWHPACTTWVGSPVLLTETFG
jgi:hypothetical protein